MIVRILEEGQYEIPDEDADQLAVLDMNLEAALEAGDDGTFRKTLSAMLNKVRGAGTLVDSDRIVVSQLALPNESMNLAEVCTLLASEEEKTS